MAKFSSRIGLAPMGQTCQCCNIMVQPVKGFVCMKLDPARFSGSLLVNSPVYHSLHFTWPLSIEDPCPPIQPTQWSKGTPAPLFSITAVHCIQSMIVNSSQNCLHRRTYSCIYVGLSADIQLNVKMFGVEPADAVPLPSVHLHYRPKLQERRTDVRFFPHFCCRV